VPVYEYACTECGERLEAKQSFTDDPLAVCPVCGGRLRKVLSAVGVVFKGSGFYRTDSRNANSSDKKEPAAAAAAKDGSSSGGDSVSPAGKSSESGSSDKPGASSAKSTPKSTTPAAT
jgi:putative FmdB family regulatory protein